MALGTITPGVAVGQEGSNVIIDLISFPGDGTYPSGGTPDFQAAVRAALGKGNLELLAVVPSDCGGYVPVYDKAADKLKVYEQTSTVTSPLIQTVTGNLAGTTFNLLVICK